MFLKDLVKIANKLDNLRLLKEADTLDSIIVKYANVLEMKDESSNYYIAYHCGKPDIESEFNFNFLGTGEGTAILGPGLYFATNINIAKRYCKYKEGAVMYKAKIPKEYIYDGVKGEPKNLRESMASIIRNIEKETGKDPYRGVLPLTHGQGSVGAVVKHYGPQKAREIMIEAGILGAVGRLGSGLEIALFDTSIALIEPHDYQSLDKKAIMGPTPQKINKSGLTKEAGILDSIVRKLATPREMDDELRKVLDAGELADINEDRASSEKLNYLGLVDKVGPVPEDIKSGVKRITMSNNKISRIGNFTQSNGRKPKGLWYACGNEWLSWLTNEMPGWIGKYVYSIDVNEGSILNIRTYEQLKEFDEAYGIKSELTNVIDWGKVAKEYDGIEICPYIYEARYSLDWYYSWDVASGCIWRSSAVQSIKLIAEKTSDTIKPEGLEDWEREYPRKEDSPNWVVYK